MRKIGKAKIAVGALALIAAGALFLGSCKPALKVPLSEARYGEIVPTVSVYGEIKGVIAEMSPKIHSLIKKVNAKEGDRVVKGQVLVEFDGFETAGNELYAIQELHEKGLASDQQLEQAATALESSMLISPVEGIVTLMSNREGETVSPGSIVAAVVRPGTSYAELQIDESDIGEIRPGLNVIIYNDAFPDEKFPGKLDHIALSAELRKVGGRIKMDEEDRVFRGRVILAEGKDKLKVGMSVNADIITQVKVNALVIPREAVFSRDGRSYVYAVRGGRAKETEVVLGLKDTDNVEIISGIQERDKVIVSIPENFKNNSKVKAEK